MYLLPPSLFFFICRCCLQKTEGGLPWERNRGIATGAHALLLSGYKADKHPFSGFTDAENRLQIRPSRKLFYSVFKTVQHYLMMEILPCTQYSMVFPGCHTEEENLFSH